MLLRRGMMANRHLVHQLRVRQGLSAWHEIAKPGKSDLNIEDRLWFCGYLEEWMEYDLLQMVVSDEHFVYVSRKPNFRNDRVWATTLDEVPDDQKYQEPQNNIQHAPSVSWMLNRHPFFTTKPPA